MATAIRPYIVTDTATKTPRLVRASSQAQARNFVAHDRYSVQAATANDVINMMELGVKPEDATEDKAV